MTHNIIKYGSTDWSKLYGFQKFHALKSTLLYPKKPAGMHWLGYNDAVSWQKLQCFSLQPILKITYILSASLPAVRPSCTRCRASEISHDKGNGGGLRKCCSEDDLPTAPW